VNARFYQRRALASATLLVAVVLLALAMQRMTPVIRSLTFLTGWLLLAVLLFLPGYNFFKKLSFLPLGNSRTWLQLHVYSGWFSVALFVAHLRARWPSGGFEGLLTTFFVLTSLSGIAGLLWSRLVPRRLTARGGEVLFERIPVIRRELADRAEKLALASTTGSGSAVLAEFHARHLAGFLRGPQHFWRHLVGSQRHIHRLQARFADLSRFLDPSQRKALAELEELVRTKDTLDYHHAQQSSLKLWLFTHIPLTYGTLLLTVLHVVLVYGFAAGSATH
jgi:hypothetical protein